MVRNEEILDLVDEMMWEDCDKIEKISIEEAGLEEECPLDNAFSHGIYEYMHWFYDGDLSALSEY